MFPQLPYWPATYIKSGLAALLLAVAAMPIAIVALRRLGIVDRGGGNKIHKTPVPRGGGIVIFLAFAVAAVHPYYFSHPMKGVLIGSFFCLVVGAIDDIRGGIPATWKFLTLLLVTIIQSHYGVNLHLFVSRHPYDLPYFLDLFLTLLWIVGVTSAFNGMDNMDGLASGIATIASGMYLVIAVQSLVLAGGKEVPLAWFGLLSACLIGANLGFLVYNFGPARIFMGDSGSFFLGYMLASLGVMGEWAENRVISCTIPVLILGVPIFDFAYIIIARIFKGETRSLRAIIEHCALDHLSHRLIWIGFSRRKAVCFIYLIAVSLGISGILLRNSDSLFDSAFAFFQGIAILFIVMVLMTTAARRHIEAIGHEVKQMENTAAPANEAE